MNQNGMLGLLGIGGIVILVGVVLLVQNRTNDQVLLDRAEQLEEANGLGFDQEYAVAARQVMYNDGMRYQDYAEDGPTILFFKASWCSTCGIAQKDLDANLGELPQNITIVTVDFDSESELKTRYGIVAQHTFVQVDREGDLVALWNGGGVAEIAENLILEY